MANESLNFSLHESANIFQVPPIPTPKQSITKETRFLICEARSRGSLISDICRNFDIDRSVVIKILRRNLILPVEPNSYKFASSEDWKYYLNKMLKRISKWMILEQLNLRYPMLFNECCLERMRRLRKTLLKK